MLLSRLWLPLLLSVLCLALPVRAAAPVTILMDDELSGRTVLAVAVDPERRLIYAGLGYVYDRESRLLLVGRYDEAGALQGGWQPVAVGPRLTEPKTHRSTNRILLDAKRRKLFLAVNSSDTAAWVKRLGVLDLDAAGLPTGVARFYDVGNPHLQCDDLALHPALPLLYAVGWGGEGVFLHDLDARGEPAGPPRTAPFGGCGKTQIAVHPNGRFLYLGTYPDTIQVMETNAAGTPAARSSIRLGAESVYRRFLFTPEALLAGGKDGLRTIPLTPVGRPGGPESVRRVADGAADVLPRTGPNLELPFRLYGTDQIYPEVKEFADGTEWRTATVAADGTVQVTAAAAPRWPDHVPTLMEQAPDGTRVIVRTQLPAGFRGNRTAGWLARLTILEAEQEPATERQAQLGVKVEHLKSPRTCSLGTVAVGKPGPWSPLDGVLQNAIGMRLGGVELRGPNPGRIRLQLEFARTPKRVSAAAAPAAKRGNRDLLDGKPDEEEDVVLDESELPQPKPEHRLEAEVWGPTLALLLPTYGGVTDAGFVAAIIPFSEHAKVYAETARKCAVPPEQRPRKFLVNAGQLLGGQGHLPTLESGLDTLAKLGFNCVNSYWNGDIPPTTVGKLMDAHGFTYRTGAVYAPPSYFAYHRTLMNPEALDSWAKKLVAGDVAPHAGSPERVHHFKLADEPGWYFPQRFTEVIEDPVALAIFRDYLKAKAPTPDVFGAKRWEDVVPSGASRATDAAGRRLYYWSIEFYREQANLGMKLANEALRRATRPELTCAVNWNNFVSVAYRASPNQAIANNTIVGPDSAMGSFAWLDFGRQRCAMPFSEDWFGDAAANSWTWYADVLRSSAALGDGQFGAYTIGCCMGGHPDGAAYKIFSILSRGAKMVDVYTFGPEYFFPGNCWSERLSMYAPLAASLGLLGRAEDLLFPARPARGDVAMLLSGASTLWETDSKSPLYEENAAGLHRALTHAGYGVDAIDEVDLASGAIAARGYKVILACGPNTTRAGVLKLAEWVQAGGTLLLAPGALTADEYNEPHDAFGPAAQVKRVAVRDRETRLAEYPEVPCWSPAGERQADLPALPDTPAAGLMTGAALGRGTVAFCQFFAGVEYLRHLDSSSGLPRGYRAGLRDFLTAPLQAATCRRPAVVDQPLVEAAVLEADSGWAVVLLNWSGTPVNPLTLTLPGIRQPPQSVVSSQGSRVTFTATDTGLRLQLPLKAVDVLKVYAAQKAPQ